MKCSKRGRTGLSRVMRSPCAPSRLALPPSRRVRLETTSKTSSRERRRQNIAAEMARTCLEQLGSRPPSRRTWLEV